MSTADLFMLVIPELRKSICELPFPPSPSPSLSLSLSLCGVDGRSSRVFDCSDAGCFCILCFADWSSGHHPSRSVHTRSAASASPRTFGCGPFGTRPEFPELLHHAAGFGAWKVLSVCQWVKQGGKRCLFLHLQAPNQREKFFRRGRCRPLSAESLEMRSEFGAGHIEAPDKV